MSDNLPIPDHIKALLLGIEIEEQRLKWLPAIDFPDDCTIAHIGSNQGRQTTALSRLLKSQHTVGLDVNEENLRQAKQYIEEIKSWLNRLPLYRNNAQNEYEIQLLDQAEKALAFSFPEFIAGDICTNTTLQPKSFDLIFSDHTLYHVYCNEEGKVMLKMALEEIKRLLKQFGILAIVEPQRCPPNSLIEWQDLLATNGLVKTKSWTQDTLFYGIYKTKN